VPRSHWTNSDSSLALFALGLLCLLLGLYVFLHFWVPWLRLPEPRRSAERRTSSLRSYDASAATKPCHVESLTPICSDERSHPNWQEVPAEVFGLVDC
jgi:hypothetical protein